MSVPPPATLPCGAIPLGAAAARAVAAVRLRAMAADLPAGLTVRLLDPDDAGLLADFRVRVVAMLEDPDYYRMAGEVGSFVADHLGDRGLAAGIFRRTTLVAYGALGLPGPEDPNRGRDLDLPEAELPLVAHLSSAMVDPAERGRGLHHRLIDWRIEVADALGRRHLVTTVSARNHASWSHLARHGLYPKRLVRVGGDLVRLLVHRDFAADPVFDPATAELVPVEELTARPDLFGRGQIWGRVSVAAGTPAATATATAAAAGAVDGATLRWYALCGRRRETR
ncbi:hypothetical protein TSH100_20025 [Azospirillum sp. TSH100]|uniref:GNAT family N-acetyltransferase n=1 Tax=Azospirillum sp. TSH100 TaxID=652764 RepID=UPI000D60C5B5|nr:GNAT family N-acetyltransferase [Azospirillum sp. TSH100]PWC83845.1 hypothetical protein TSH100_20025 [Azospirillum sp. TSH100]QCG88382.1 GNAT family N-acetyltransferase [Azospirillum sp. TSH100]